MLPRNLCHSTVRGRRSSTCTRFSFVQFQSSLFSFEKEKRGLSLVLLELTTQTSIYIYIYIRTGKPRGVPFSRAYSCLSLYFSPGYSTRFIVCVSEVLYSRPTASPPFLISVPCSLFSHFYFYLFPRVFALPFMARAAINTKLSH